MSVDPRHAQVRNCLYVWNMAEYMSRICLSGLLCVLGLYWQVLSNKHTTLRPTTQNTTTLALFHDPYWITEFNSEIILAEKTPFLAVFCCNLEWKLYFDSKNARQKHTWHDNKEHSTETGKKHSNVLSRSIIYHERYSILYKVGKNTGVFRKYARAFVFSVQKYAPGRLKIFFTFWNHPKLS